ncbi:hypothetical protein RvY_08918 [Ramazzottius varieornatus]|uniref:SAP30-binding protein n=1 Tax=Ramazzottius varieornatus TaxID=947166 RepID=A0A1D1V9R1_RAMVA|nr:hypothetical protein RvY_08918 [Ramazzottius varieornatus]
MPLLTNYGESDEESDHGRHEEVQSRNALSRLHIGGGADTTVPSEAVSSLAEEHTTAATPIGFPQCIGLTDTEQVRIPDETRGPISPELESKIAAMAEKQRKDGVSINDNIQRNKEFRNPSIYEKLIEHCKIDEYGTNFPPADFDPKRWDRDGADHITVEQLADAQAAAMEKYQREKRAKGGVDSSADAKRKSRWETGPAKPIVANNLLAAKMTGQVMTKIPSSGNLSKSTR